MQKHQLYKITSLQLGIIRHIPCHWYSPTLHNLSSQTSQVGGNPAITPSINRRIVIYPPTGQHRIMLFANLPTFNIQLLLSPLFQLPLTRLPSLWHARQTSVSYLLLSSACRQHAPASSSRTFLADYTQSKAVAVGKVHDSEDIMLKATLWQLKTALHYITHLWCSYAEDLHEQQFNQVRN